MTDQTRGVVGGRAAVRRAAARATRRTRYLLTAVGATLATVLVGNAVGSAATPATPAQICEVNNKGPAGYPSILRGCNYGYCTAPSPFPAQVSSLGTVRSNWSTKGPTAGGTQRDNTAYDIWFDPTKTNAGRNTGAETMIWLNRTSWVQPIGKPYYDVNIGGTVYTVWYGKTDLPVISCVRKTPTTSVTNLPIELFTRDAMLRGVVRPAWYLTSAQAGFEPWTGGTGLRTNSFSVTRNGA